MACVTTQFWRLGVPGPWDKWPIFPFDKQRPDQSALVESDKWVANVSWVARLYSGNKAQEMANAFVERGQARAAAIKTFIDFLDLQVMKGALDPRQMMTFDPRAIEAARVVYERCKCGAPEGRMVGDLLARAKDALQRRPYSVVDKQRAAPSGDMHDYYNPSRRERERDRALGGMPGSGVDGTSSAFATAGLDRFRLQAMFDDTTTLALAHLITGDAEYAAHAVLLIRTWFLVPATAMNPNLVWSRHDADSDSVNLGSGVMDMKDLHYFLDAVRIVASTGALPKVEVKQLQEWMRSYSTWLVKDEKGVEETKEDNYLGTAFDLQLAAIYAFINEPLKYGFTLALPFALID